jgi:hypothetical protein
MITDPPQLQPHGALTDADRVRIALEDIPPLRAAGPMHAIAQPAAGTGVTRYVAADTIAAVAVQHRETLCTGGLTSAVVLAAQGTTPHGRMVIAMLRQGPRFSADDAICAMRRTMTSMGVGRYTTMVLGGELSRDPGQPGSVVQAIALAAAAHREGTLVCGRVGVNQMSQRRVHGADLGEHALPAWPDIPSAPICAVLSAQDFRYAAEIACDPVTGRGNATLFDEERVVPVGLPLAAVVRQQP